MDIISNNGTTIKHEDINVKSILNITTILYGPSGSGKSTVIVHMLKELQKYVPMVFAICPSEPQNHTYHDIVPYAVQRYYDTTESLFAFLKDLWDRQALATAMYKKANSIKILRSLYEKYARNAKADRQIQKLINLRNSAVNQIRDTHKRNEAMLISESKRVDTEIETTMVAIYRFELKPHKSVILEKHRKRLTIDEKYSLTHLLHNPNIIIIFDDCASILKKVQTTPLFKDYFYRGRHYHITNIIAVQDDTNMDSDLRKNAFRSVFCNANVASAFFTRKSNDFSKEYRKNITYINASIFGRSGNEGYKKLIYDRTSAEPFRYLEAQMLPPFKLGSNAFRKYCKQIKNEDSGIDETNEFYDLFTV